MLHSICSLCLNAYLFEIILYSNIHGCNDCYIMVGADGTVLFSLWINFSMMIFWHFIINILESFIDCTIIVIMQHVIVYVVCLLSNCTVFIVLYSMYQSLVFIAVSAVSVLVFYLLSLKLRPLRMRSRSTPPTWHVLSHEEDGGQ